MFKKVSYPISLVLVLGLVLTSSVAQAADPVGWWKCDEGSGTTVADSSGRGYDGTLSGDADWAAGQIEGAIEFGGEGLLSVPGDCWNTAWGARAATEVTFCMWAYTENVTQTSVTVRAGPGLNLHIPWSGGIYFDIGSPVSRINRGGASDLWVSQWSHWAFTFTPGDQRIYLNGELFQSGTSTTPSPIETSAGTMQFGASGAAGQGYFGLMDDIRLYNVVLTEAEIKKVMLNIGEGFASDPSPADKAPDVPRNVTLEWTSSPYDVTHDVYFGANANDVSEATVSGPLDVLRSQGQAKDDTDYVIPERLEFGTTYYWRIDEVNAAPDNTIFTGDVWSFTVEPLAYPIVNVTATSNAPSNAGEGPVNTVNGSGLSNGDEHSTTNTDMWMGTPAGDPLTIEYEFDTVYKLHEMLVWNYNVQFELMLGFGLKDVTIEYSEDGEDWTVLGDVVFNQATAQATYTANTAVDFGGVAAQYVKITINSGWGVLPVPQYGLSEVRFLHIPAKAREPQPADGAVDVAADADLTWRAGREAVSHEVYLSTDPDALELIDTTSTTTVDPGVLDLGATYYWRIDEVNDAEAISTWAGAVWSFSTEPYIVVEDFESYTDDIEAGEAIFLNWIDGYEINNNGSLVGHLEAPFAETTIVHGGGQSMPLFFDNAGGVTVSEAERTLDAPMDWTAHGIKSLSLAFAGDAGNTTGQLYLKVNGTKVVYGGSADDLKVSGWLAWTIDVATLGNVSNVTTLTIGVEGAGASGVLYVDDIRLYPQESEMVEPVEPDPAGLAAYYELNSDFQDSSGNGNHAEAVGDAFITSNPARASVASLDGLGDGIRVPALGTGTAAEMTISLWMRTDITWTSGFFALYHNNGWDAGDVHLHVSNGGVFSAGVNGLAGGDLRGSTLVEVDQWYNVTVTVSGVETNLYVNGIQESSRIPTAAPESFNFGEGHLGIWLNGAAFERALTGQIDDVRFYDRVLSYAEVMGLADRTTPLFKPF